MGTLPHAAGTVPSRVHAVGGRGGPGGSRAKGLLFKVLIDGEWADVIAVDEDRAEGVEGVLMIEILLAGHVWGKGLGTAVYRHLSEQLPEPAKVLLGTIDARNVPAVYAATRLGRVDVGGLGFVRYGNSRHDPEPEPGGQLTAAVA